MSSQEIIDPLRFVQEDLLKEFSDNGVESRFLDAIFMKTFVCKEIMDRFNIGNSEEIIPICPLSFEAIEDGELGPIWPEDFNEGIPIYIMY